MNQENDLIKLLEHKRNDREQLNSKREKYKDAFKSIKETLEEYKYKRNNSNIRDSYSQLEERYKRWEADGDRLAKLDREIKTLEEYAKNPFFSSPPRDEKAKEDAVRSGSSVSSKGLPGGAQPQIEAPTTTSLQADALRDVNSELYENTINSKAFSMLSDDDKTYVLSDTLSDESKKIESLTGVAAANVKESAYDKAIGIRGAAKSLATISDIEKALYVISPQDWYTARDAIKKDLASGDLINPDEYFNGALVNNLRIMTGSTDDAIISEELKKYEEQINNLNISELEGIIKDHNLLLSNDELKTIYSKLGAISLIPSIDQAILSPVAENVAKFLATVIDLPTAVIHRIATGEPMKEGATLREHVENDQYYNALKEGLEEEYPTTSAIAGWSADTARYVAEIGMLTSVTGNPFVAMTTHKMLTTSERFINEDMDFREYALGLTEAAVIGASFAGVNAIMRSVPVTKIMSEKVAEKLLESGMSSAQAARYAGIAGRAAQIPLNAVGSGIAGATSKMAMNIISGEKLFKGVPDTAVRNIGISMLFSALDMIREGDLEHFSELNKEQREQLFKALKDSTPETINAVANEVKLNVLYNKEYSHEIRGTRINSDAKRLYEKYQKLSPKDQTSFLETLNITEQELKRATQYDDVSRINISLEKFVDLSTKPYIKKIVDAFDIKLEDHIRLSLGRKEFGTIVNDPREIPAGDVFNITKGGTTKINGASGDIAVKTIIKDGVSTTVSSEGFSVSEAVGDKAAEAIDRTVGADKNLARGTREAYGKQPKGAKASSDSRPGDSTPGTQQQTVPPVIPAPETTKPSSTKKQDTTQAPPKAEKPPETKKEGTTKVDEKPKASGEKKQVRRQETKKDTREPQKPKEKIEPTEKPKEPEIPTKETGDENVSQKEKSSQQQEKKKEKTNVEAKGKWDKGVSTEDKQQKEGTLPIEKTAKPKDKPSQEKTEQTKETEGPKLTKEQAEEIADLNEDKRSAEEELSKENSKVAPNEKRVEELLDWIDGIEQEIEEITQESKSTQEETAGPKESKQSKLSEEEMKETLDREIESLKQKVEPKSPTSESKKIKEISSEKEKSKDGIYTKTTIFRKKKGDTGHVLWLNDTDKPGVTKNIKNNTETTYAKDLWIEPGSDKDRKYYNNGYSFVSNGSVVIGRTEPGERFGSVGITNKDVKDGFKGNSELIKVGLILDQEVGVKGVKHSSKTKESLKYDRHPVNIRELYSSLHSLLQEVDANGIKSTYSIIDREGEAHYYDTKELYSAVSHLRRAGVRLGSIIIGESQSPTIIKSDKDAGEDGSTIYFSIVNPIEESQGATVYQSGAIRSEYKSEELNGVLRDSVFKNHRHLPNTIKTVVKNNKDRASQYYKTNSKKISSTDKAATTIADDKNILEAMRILNIQNLDNPVLNRIYATKGYSFVTDGNLMFAAPNKQNANVSIDTLSRTYTKEEASIDGVLGFYKAIEKDKTYKSYDFNRNIFKEDKDVTYLVNGAPVNNKDIAKALRYFDNTGAGNLEMLLSDDKSKSIVIKSNSNSGFFAVVTPKDIAKTKTFDSLSEEHTTSDMFNDFSHQFAEVGDGKPKSVGEQVLSTTKEDGVPIRGFGAIELPEMIQVIRMFLGDSPRVHKHTKGHYGAFRRFGKLFDIIVRGDIFEKGKYQEGFAEKVLAHEIGHLIDFIGDSNYPVNKDIKSLRGPKALFAKALISASEFSDRVFEGFFPEASKASAIIADIEKQIQKELNKVEPDMDAVDKLYLDINRVAMENISEVNLYNELFELSEMWRPPDEDDGMDEYRRMFTEVFADFISVMFNNPELARSHAPLAFERFYGKGDNAFVQEYARILAMMDGADRSELIEERYNNIVEMFDKKVEGSLDSREDFKYMSILSMIRQTFVDDTEAISSYAKVMSKRIEEEGEGGEEAREKSGRVLRDSKEARDIIKLYRNIPIRLATKLNAYFDIVKKIGDLGIREEVDLYMFFSKGATSETAYSLGMQGNPSEVALENLKERWGEEKFAQVEAIANDVLSWYNNDVMSSLLEHDYISLSYYGEAKSRQANNEFYYPSIMSDLAASGFDTDPLKKAVGHLGEVISPLLSFEVQAIKLIKKAVRNRGLLTLINSLQVEKIPVANNMDSIRMTPPDKGHKWVVFREKGVPHASQLPVEVLKSIDREYFSMLNNPLFKPYAVLTAIFKNIVVNMNPGFLLLTNPARDSLSTLLANQIKGEKMSLKGLSELLKRGHKIVWNLDDSENMGFFREGVYAGVIVNQPYMGYTSSDFSKDVMDIINIAGKEGATLFKYFDEDRAAAVRLIQKLWYPVDKLAQRIEAAPKVGAYEYYKARNLRDIAKGMDMTASEFLYHLRRTTGTPDASAHGTLSPLLNFTIPFYQVSISAIDRTVKIFSNKNMALGALLAYGILNIPALIKVLQKNGVFNKLVDWLDGDDEKEAGSKEHSEKVKIIREFNDQINDLYGGVPSYYFTRYITLPLYKTETGKVACITIPAPIPMIVGLGDTLYQALKNASEDANMIPRGVVQIYKNVDLYAGVPTSAPVIKVSYDLSRYLSGEIPTGYNGREIFTTIEQQAGFKATWKKFLNHTLNTFGLPSVIPEKQINAEVSPFEKAVNSTPWLKRIIKFTDAGYAEAILDETSKRAGIDARFSVYKRDIEIDAINEVGEHIKELKRQAKDSGEEVSLEDINLLVAQTAGEAVNIWLSSYLETQMLPKTGSIKQTIKLDYFDILSEVFINHHSEGQNLRPLLRTVKTKRDGNQKIVAIHEATRMMSDADTESFYIMCVSLGIATKNDIAGAVLERKKEQERLSQKKQKKKNKGRKN